MSIPDAAAASAAAGAPTLSAENDDNDSSLFSFKNCSLPTSPAKLQGKLLLPDSCVF
jgi:hypothetical protein